MQSQYQDVKEGQTDRRTVTEYGQTVGYTALCLCIADASRAKKIRAQVAPVLRPYSTVLY